MWDGNKMVTWEELGLSAYQAFRITEAEHIQQAYNGGSNSLENAEIIGLTGSGETDGQH